MKIETSDIAFQILQSKFNPLAEEIWGIFLDSNLKLISVEMVHRGTVNFCHFHARDLFREAIRHNSSFFLFAHNHPSGDPNPSESDIKLTKKIKKISIYLELPLLDHLIFTKTSYFSFKNSNLL